MINPFEPMTRSSSQDVHDPLVQRERLWSQDRALLDAVNLLANKIRSLPHDTLCPNTEPRALLVGGFVRDALLGLKPKDMDVEVYGVSPERLESLLEQMYPGRVNSVGRAFGILKVALGDGLDFDVSIPRSESKMGSGHTGFVVKGDPSMDVKEAARRRDFTINALSADPMTGEVLDLFGGVDDLVEKRLRVTDVERFQDDPLRVYRAVQFAARFGFTLESESKQLMREMVERGDLTELSKERISEEIGKLLLKSPRPSIGFEQMRDLGIIERDYPELHALIGTPQEPEWHPEGDVWIHTMMVLDAAAKIAKRESPDGSPLFTDRDRLGILLGAVCHDLGKPATTESAEKDGVMRLRSLAHEQAGKEPTKQLFARWKFSEELEQTAIAIATEHLKPGELYRQHVKGNLDAGGATNAIRKLLKRIHPTSWRVLIASSEADHRGRGLAGVDRGPYPSGEWFAEVIKKNRLDEAPTKKLLRGEDLMALGMKPGREIGEMIKAIELLRDSGEIVTHEQAMEEARRRLAG